MGHPVVVDKWDIERVTRLLQTNADLNTRDLEGRTPLLWAIWRRSDEAWRDNKVTWYETEETVKLLLARDSVDPNIRDKSGRGPLHMAVEKYDESVVGMLLDRHDVDPNIQDNSGRVPLHLAIANNAEWITRWLLVNSHADPSIRDNSGSGPLHLAIAQNAESTVRLLLAHGRVDLNAKDSCGWTPLHTAVMRPKSKAVVPLLLAQEGVDLNAKDRCGFTPLSQAIWGENDEIVELLLAQDGIDINSRDNEGCTPLLQAIEMMHGRIVKLLLAQDGIDINAKNNKGFTPLLRAVGSTNGKIVKLLLAQERIDVNAKDNEGFTPLFQAVRSGNDEIIELLVTQDGIDINAKDNEGHTPLLWAVEKGHMSVVNRLIQKDDVTLHMLVRQEKWDLVWCLLDAGYENANVCDNSGMTPIRLAVQKKQGRLIHKLLECKADTTGITVREWREAFGNQANGIVQISKDGDGVGRLRFPTVDDLSQTFITTETSLFVVMDSSLWGNAPIADLKATTPNILQTSLLPERNGSGIDVSISTLFPVTEHLAPKDFGTPEVGECRVAWKMLPPTSRNDVSWRPIVYFSMLLPCGWVPVDDVDFFRQFIGCLKIRWLAICRQEEKALNKRRLCQLRSEGKDPDLMHYLAEDAQKLAELHDILEDQIRQADEFARTYSQRFHRNLIPDSNFLDEFERSVSDQIRKLDQRVKDLLQIEFAWTSINETRISTKLAKNVMLLTYVSIFYLPLGFCAALWAIPNITDSATRNPFIITTVLVGLATLTVAFNADNIIESVGRACQWCSDKALNGLKFQNANLVRGTPRGKLPRGRKLMSALTGKKQANEQDESKV